MDFLDGLHPRAVLRTDPVRREEHYPKMPARDSDLVVKRL